MKINRASWIGIGGALTAVLLAAGIGGVWLGLFFDTNDIKRTERATYDHAISKLEVDLAGGDVTVKAGATNLIQVTRKIVWNGDTQPQYSETFDGDTMRVTTEDCPQWYDNCAIDYEIRVPASVAVTITTEGGDVETANLPNVTSAHTSGGDVDISGNTSPLKIRTSGGDVSVADSAADVDAETSGGDVELAFAKAPANVRAVTSGGDIEISVPDGSVYDVDARTSGGDTNVDVDHSNRSPNVITARGSGGNITVRYR